MKEAAIFSGKFENIYCAWWIYHLFLDILVSNHVVNWTMTTKTKIRNNPLAHHSWLVGNNLKNHSDKIIKKN